MPKKSAPKKRDGRAKKKRSPAQIAATERMLAALAARKAKAEGRRAPKTPKSRKKRKNSASGPANSARSLKSKSAVDSSWFKA